VITGVASFGMFVEIIDTRCEGLLSIKSLDDDFYTFDEPNYRLVGLETGKTYSLGDKLKVRVAKTDLVRRTIDLELPAKNRHSE
jgi:ribonuclease R